MRIPKLPDCQRTQGSIVKRQFSEVKNKTRDEARKNKKYKAR